MPVITPPVATLNGGGTFSPVVPVSPGSVAKTISGQGSVSFNPNQKGYLLVQVIDQISGTVFAQWTMRISPDEASAGVKTFLAVFGGPFYQIAVPVSLVLSVQTLDATASAPIDGSSGPIIASAALQSFSAA